MRLNKGLVQIYTGNGKGKTTASLGLALRASGAGLRVCIIQFIKGKPYSEFNAIKKIPHISIIQLGSGCFIKGKPKAKDIKCAEKGLARAEKIIKSKRFDLVILDEVNVAISIGLIKNKEVLRIILKKPRKLELILTGRKCPPSFYKYADLVTDMKEVKHPYQRGVKARRGIEF